MKIFQMDLDTFELSFEPEVLAIKEFAALINRDKVKGKPKATAELAYVWFFCDVKSDFLDIIDEEERKAEIISVLDGLPKDWKPDALVEAAIVRYKGFKSVVERMLDDNRTILDNMSKYSKAASTNLDEHDMTKIQRFLEGLPKLLNTLASLEDMVLKEKGGMDSHRGNQQKALLEDEE